MDMGTILSLLKYYEKCQLVGHYTPGGEINTIQTGLKTLDHVILLGASFSVCRLRVPLDGQTENDTPRRKTRPGFPTLSVFSMYLPLVSELSRAYKG